MHGGLLLDGPTGGATKGNTGEATNDDDLQDYGYAVTGDLPLATSVAEIPTPRRTITRCVGRTLRDQVNGKTGLATGSTSQAVTQQQSDAHNRRWA